MPAIARLCLLLLALPAMAGCRSDPPTRDETSSRIDPWQHAQERGIDFRAVGQEPGWYVEIDHEGSIHLIWDYMEREVTMPAVKPLAAAGRTTYAVSSAAQRLTIVIEDRPCSDVMSGAPYPNTVIATIDGRELRGCGQFLK